MARDAKTINRENITNKATSFKELIGYGITSFSILRLCNFRRFRQGLSIQLANFLANLSLVRQVFIFYDLGRFITYDPHIFISCITPQKMTGKNKSNRTSPRLQAESKTSKKGNKGSVSKSKTASKPTKTQIKKHLKQVKDGKAIALRTQKELQALKKKHAAEEKAMEKMIEDAKKMTNAINISSDEDSQSSENSASTHSDNTITESAFANSSNSQMKKRAARNQKKLQQHLSNLEEGKDEMSDNESDTQSTSEANSESESTSHDSTKNDNSKEDDIVPQDSPQEKSEVHADDATVIGNQNVTKPSKPAASFILPKRKHIVFCKGKITVSKSDSSNEKYSATDKLKRTFMSFMTTLLKIDKRLLIFEHDDPKNERYISSPQQIPDTPSNLQKFFDGNYRPGPAQQIIWFQVKLGLDINDESNFFLDAKCLFDDKKKHAIFRKDLQVPATETIGYFLYSHGKQNRERLMETLNYLLKDCYKIKYPISIRWQKIISKYATKGKNKKNVDKEIESKAYHVEVAKGHAGPITKAIAHMYSSKRKCPPQKEKMRYVPYPNFVTNTSTKIQYNLIKNLQGWFIAGTSFASSFDICDLDEVYDGLPTLREFIMEMKFQDEQLFTSVDFSFNGKCVMFVFPTDYENEAHNKIADLPSYAMHKHGIKFLQKYFHPEAYERAEEAPWNEEEGRAVSQLSEEFEAIINECKGLSWLKDPNAATMKQDKETSEPEANKPALFNRPRPNDDASLDTFGVNTTESNKRSVTPEKDPHQPRKKKKSRVIGSDVVMNNVADNDVGELTDDDDDPMDIDEVTVSTLNSRMQNIEDSVQNMNDNIASTIQEQFAIFFQNAKNQPPGTGSPSKTTQVTNGSQAETPPVATGGVDC